MPWPKNEALEAVLEALFNFRQIEGPDKLAHLLEAELGREAVLRRLVADRKAAKAKELADVALGDARDETIELLSAALEFYADGDNYTPRKGQRLPVIARDKGKIARQALASLGDEDEGDEGGEE